MSCHLSLHCIAASRIIAQSTVPNWISGTVLLHSLMQGRSNLDHLPSQPDLYISIETKSCLAPMLSPVLDTLGPVSRGHHPLVTAHPALALLPGDPALHPAPLVVCIKLCYLRSSFLCYTLHLEAPLVSIFMPCPPRCNEYEIKENFR